MSCEPAAKPSKSRQLDRLPGAIHPQLTTPMAMLSDDIGDTDLKLYVTPAVRADAENGTTAQFALAFLETTDNDDLADNMIYSDPELRVVYFVH